MIPPVRRRTADHHTRGHTDMELSPTGHLDTFARDNLPPDDQWPALEFTIDDVVYPDRLNAATALIDEPTARLGPDRLALTTPEGQRWTYGQLLERANQVARVLVEDHGLVPGNRVLLRAPNNPWLVAAWLGTLKAGGVVVTTMPLLREAEVDKLIELTKPTVAITDHRFIDDIVAPALAHGVSLIAYGGDGDEDLTADHGDETDDLRQCRHRRRRRRPALPHLGDHRRAQGDDALPPRHPHQRRHLRAPHPEDPPR
jgi:2-aminobenzoate-CoA ligase